MAKELKLHQNGTRASFKPESFNDQDNTVEIVIATETEVMRRDWDGNKYIEILVCDKKSVRDGRLKGGNVQLVDTHSTYSVSTVFGRVISYRFENRTIVGTVLLSSRAEVAGIVTDIKTGVLANCSVGYDIFEAEVMGEKDDALIVRVTDWEPKEVSMCAVNADVNSGVRSDKNNLDKPFNLTQEKRTMPNENAAPAVTPVTAEPAAAPAVTPVTAAAATVPAAAPAPVVAPVAAEPVDAGRAAQVMERQRVTEILTAVRAAKMEPEYANNLIEKGVSADAARQEILNKLDEGSRAAGVTGVQTASVGRDLETEGRREALTDMLVMRAMPGTDAEKVLGINAERAKRAMQMRGSSLMELAKEAATRSGVDIRDLDKMGLVKRSITSSTSDFPVILDGMARRVLLANYNIVADTWRRFCAVGSVTDFREWKRLRLGTLANLQPVGENGEFKNKKISDADFEKISVQTWGDILNVSRQMIINDDLDAFSKLAQAQGRAAARTIEARVYAMFAANSGNGPLMADGLPLFHASHGNIAAVAAAPTVASVEAAELLMGQQMDKDGNDFLDITPAIWLGPKQLSGDVKVLNEAQYDINVSNKFQVPNKVRGMYSDIVGTPRLSGTAWYSLADPNQEPVFEVAFLDGVQTPVVESQEGFDVDGMRWKTRLDFDTAAIGYKGIVKNAGA